MMAFAVVAMGSCTPAGPDEGGEGTQQPTAVTFTVAATEVGETTATVTVSHDGNAENTWYGFLTTDVKTAALTLAYGKIADVKAEDLVTGTTATINLTDLELSTEYKYVVFGMNADGSFYGTPGEATFTTEDGRSMSVNEAWTIEYVGNVDGVDQEGAAVVYENCVNITATDENTYYLDYFATEDWATVQTDMYGYVESLIAYMKNYLNQFNNAYGTNYTLADMLGKGNDSLSLGELDPGNYVAALFGITADGKVSRLYAVSEEFEVVEEDPTPEYSAWIGNWTVSGAGSEWSATGGSDGQGAFVEGNVQFDITISKYVNNKSFLVDGWNGVEGLPFLAKYNKEYNVFDITGQILAENVEFQDGSVATMILMAGLMDGYVYTDYELAYAYNDTENATLGVNPYKYTMNDGSSFSFPEIIHFVQFEGEDGLYYFADIISGTTLALAPAAAAPAEVMGLVGKPIFNGKELRLNLHKPFEFYKAGARKSNVLNF